MTENGRKLKNGMGGKGSDIFLSMAHNENNKLVLTGVTGRKSGGVLVEYLSSHLERVTGMFPGGISVICRETSNTEKVQRLLPDAKICRGDFNSSSFLVEVLSNADTVIHVAGIHSSRMLIDVAVKVNVRRLILVHTTGIYSKYKEAGKEYRQIDSYVIGQCKEHGIVLNILRPTMIYGNPYDNNIITFVKMVDRLPVMPIVNDARYELQPVYYRDLGKTYFDVLMNEGATANKNYDLSGGEVIQLRDLLTVIGENLGKQVHFVSCPYPIAYLGAWFVYMATLGRMDIREKVQRLCEPRAYGHEDATRDFGYAPMTFREGIVDEVKEYLAMKAGRT